MLDDFIPSLEFAQSQGAVIVLKWDGLRQSNRCTVVITRQDTDYVFREDAENITAALQRALADYKAKHQI